MPRTRWLALTVLCAATLMIILDGTIVTVALPSIQHDLGFSPAALSWVLNAYLIAFGGLLPLAGRLGDLVGRKRVFLAGLAAFAAASLLCGLSVTPQMLIAARFVQGAGAAMVSAVSLGMIAMLFTEPAERQRAIGAYSFVGAAGASIGLAAGGLLTQSAGWHWIFFVNLPIAAAAGLPAARLLAADRGLGLRAGADWPGAAASVAGLMTGIYAIVETARYGWLSAHTLGTAAVSVVLLAAFAVRQAKARMPLLPTRILASRTVAGANLAQLLVIAAAFGFQVIIVLYFQHSLGYGPARAGLTLLPVPAIIGVVSLGLFARLAGRVGARTVLLAGLALIAAGLALLTRVPAPAEYAAQVLPWLLVFSIGGGLVLPALTALGMSAAGPGDAGAVSGLFNTTQQVGAALGVAVLTTLAAARTAGLHAPGHAAVTALTSGYHVAFGTGAGLAMAALIVATVIGRPRPQRPGGTGQDPGAVTPASRAAATSGG